MGNCPAHVETSIKKKKKGKQNHGFTLKLWVYPRGMQARRLEHVFVFMRPKFKSLIYRGVKQIIVWSTAGLGQNPSSLLKDGDPAVQESFYNKYIRGSSSQTAYVYNHVNTTEVSKDSQPALLWFTHESSPHFAVTPAAFISKGH